MAEDKIVRALNDITLGGHVILKAGKSYTVMEERGDLVSVTSESGSCVGFPKSFFGNKKEKAKVRVSGREEEFLLIREGAKNSRVQGIESGIQEMVLSSLVEKGE